MWPTRMRAGYGRGGRDVVRARASDGSSPDIAAAFLKVPAPARRLKGRRLLLVTERLRSTGRCSRQGRRERRSLAADRAIEREALAGSSARSSPLLWRRDGSCRRRIRTRGVGFGRVERGTSRTRRALEGHRVDAGARLCGFAGEVRQKMVGVQVADLERRRELDALPGPTARRRERIEEAGRRSRKISAGVAAPSPWCGRSHA